MLRWNLSSHCFFILRLTIVQGAGCRPYKRLAQGNALGRANTPMRPEGAKALGDRSSEGAKAFAPSEDTLHVCDCSLIDSKSWIIFFVQTNSLYRIAMVKLFAFSLGWTVKLRNFYADRYYLLRPFSLGWTIIEVACDWYGMGVDMWESIMNVGTTNDKLGKHWGRNWKDEEWKHVGGRRRKRWEKKEKILLISQRTLIFALVNINESRSSYKSLIAHYT